MLIAIFRLEHLVVDAADHRRHLGRDAPGEDDQVSLARGGPKCLEAEAGDVHTRGHDRHHLDRAAGEAECQREHRVALRPRDGAVERRGHDRLLDDAVEVIALEVASKHVASHQLARAELVGRLAGYFHSSAPLLQT